ncbi:replication factor RFC1 C terminal domain-containing protein [Tirmania nivea]|nr:replication factor RFC1 C terminal domain-containing protein [Tirmania nivea]
MPVDIRNFFAPKGGGGGASSQDKSKATLAKGGAAAKKGATPARTRKKRVIVDSEDEAEDPPSRKKKTPERAAPPPKKEEEAVDASTYFSGKNKITRTAPTKASKPPLKKIIVQPSKPVKEEENYFVTDDDEDYGDDIFAAEYKKHNDDDDKLRRTNTQSTTGPFENLGDTQNTASFAKVDKEDVDMMDVGDDDDHDDDFVIMDDEEDVKPKKRATPAIRTSSTASKKRRIVTSDDEEFFDVKPAKAVKTATAKKTTATPKKAPARTPKKKAADEDEPPSKVQKILDSVPTVRPPTPPPKEADGKKFTFRDFKAKQNARAAPPPGAGTKEIPTGADNCLAGLTFVFTGELDTLSREDGQQLVKRYGGKCTIAPSKKTSFVVLGKDAGPKKLETIRQNNIKTIDEDGLYHLIRTLPANGGDSKAAVAAEAKRAAEEKKIIQLAKEMERTMTPLSKGKGKETDNKQPAPVSLDGQLWTVKYAPVSMAQICGNKTQIDKLQNWLRNWHQSAKYNFQKLGKDGSGGYRAVMIHGPPGVGKTTAAHLVAKLEGFDIVESNASDTRSKKLMEASLNGVLDNRSLMGYFGKGSEVVDKAKQKLVLIMDEVDGMSAGDRGGVGQLAAICRKTSIPIICICNERKLPKMRPFDHVTFDLGFRRPDATAIRSRVMSIVFREGLKIPPNVIDALVEGTGSDIRQIINMISAFAVNGKSMDFDQGKAMSKQWEKHVILKPWDIASKLLGPSMFSPNANKSLNDKLELYFNDHEFSYLMIQENYLKTNPSRSTHFSGKERNLKNLELLEAASESISDGDLVDAMIHGQQQHWSLMPVHGVFSTVAPSSYVYGGYGGQMFGFTSWLGNNSKQSKLSRFVKEIQSHMRLCASGDRHEIRESYVPVLWDRLPKRLEKDGKEAIPRVIQLMDSYFLTRDDFDAIVELGVGPMSEENLKIQTQVKTTFTRAYNAIAHPLPFIKATMSAAAAGGPAKKAVPDLEEAIEESDDEAVLLASEEGDEMKEEEEEMDLSKDKYVKAKKLGSKGKAVPKKAAAGSSKAKTKAKPAAKGKGKQEASEGEEMEEDSEEVKPAKRGAGAGRGRGRGRR